METRHGVTTRICNLLHFRELIFATCREIEEGKLVKVLCLLIGFLDNLSRCELLNIIDIVFGQTLWLPCFRAC